MTEAREFDGHQVAGKFDGTTHVELKIPPIVAAKILLFMENGGVDLLAKEFPLAFAGMVELRECIDHLLTGHKSREITEGTWEPPAGEVAYPLLQAHLNRKRLELPEKADWADKSMQELPVVEPRPTKTTAAGLPMRFPGTLYGTGTELKNGMDA